MQRMRGRHHFDRISSDFIDGLPQMVVGNQYYVSANDGADTNSGRQPEEALETIQAAIDLSNATIDWGATPKKYNIIWVEPGVYAENLTPAYYCYIIGLGLRGTDTQAEIHPATGSVFTGTFLGSALINLWMEVDEQDAEILDLGICNNSLIKDCVFALGANVTGVVGIDTDNCTHLTVEGCDFESGQLQDMAYAMYFRGGANKYLHQARIRNNNIFAKTVGIYIAASCTDSGSIIEKNNIHVVTTGKGIYNLGDGHTLIIENDIIIDGAGDAISTTGGAGKTLYNKTLVNSSYALETA